MLRISRIAVIIVLALAVDYGRCMSETEKRTSKVNYVEQFDKLNKAGRDESLNAAPYYQKAFDLYVELPDDFNSSDLKIWPDELDEQKYKAVKEWITANSSALKQLQTGSTKSGYWIEHKEQFMVSIVFPELSKFRGLALALNFRAKLYAIEGDFERSFSDLIVCCRLGNHLGGPKTAVEQLVGIAVKSISTQTAFEILNKTKPEVKIMKRFQGELEDICSESGRVFDFTAEKLFMYDNIQGIFTDDGKGDGYMKEEQIQKDLEGMKELMGEEFSEPEKEKYKKLKRNETLSLAEKLYAYLEEICSETPGQLHNENKQPEKIIKEMLEDNFLLNLLSPAFLKVLDLAWRERTHTGALLTTIALFRYKADKGSFPEEISQLVSGGYLKGMTIDAYSNKPLIYKKVKDDFVLYSVGRDFDDDKAEVRVKITSDGNGDIVFWPVEKSR